MVARAFALSLALLGATPMAHASLIGDVVTAGSSTGLISGTATVIAGGPEFLVSVSSETCGNWTDTTSINIEATTISMSRTISKATDSLPCGGSAGYGQIWFTVSDIDWSEGPGVYIVDVISSEDGFVLDSFTADSVTFHFPGAGFSFDNSTSFSHGFSITATLVPVPEPQTLLLVVCGLASLQAKWARNSRAT